MIVLSKFYFTNVKVKLFSIFISYIRFRNILFQLQIFDVWKKQVSLFFVLKSDKEGITWRLMSPLDFKFWWIHIKILFDQKIDVVRYFLSTDRILMNILVCFRMTASFIWDLLLFSPSLSLSEREHKTITSQRYIYTNGFPHVF